MKNKVPEESRNKGERDVSNEDEDDEKQRPSVDYMDDDEIKAEDYNYLLGMAIWSLTAERIAKLEQDKADKEKMVVKLKRVHIHDMWREDLEAIQQELQKINEKEIELMEKSTGKGAKKGKAKNKKQKMITDIDFEVDVKKKRPAPPPKRTEFYKAEHKVKKGKQDTSTSDTGFSSDLMTKNIDDLPLKERVKMKIKMGTLASKNVETKLMSDSIEEDSKMEVDDSDHEQVVTKKPKGVRKRNVHKRMVIDSSDSEGRDSSGSDFALE